MEFFKYYLGKSMYNSINLFKVKNYGTLFLLKFILIFSACLILNISNLNAEELGIFKYGMYGRVNVLADSELESAKKISLATYSDRLYKDSYQEMTFQYIFSKESRVQTTLSISEPYFHQTGQFKLQSALREAYLEQKVSEIYIWAGSRMVRGQDVYQFDMWPLYHWNLFGGGFFSSFVDLHFGSNQLLTEEELNAYIRNYPKRGGVGAEAAQVVDRPRWVLNLKLHHDLIKNDTVRLNAGFICELHWQKSSIKEENDYRTYYLKEQKGSAFGAALSGNLKKLNYYFSSKFESGLATFDPMHPFTITLAETKQDDRKRLLTSLSLLYPLSKVDISFAAYHLYINDGDENEDDWDDRSEWQTAIRADYYPVKPFIVSLSYNIELLDPKGPLYETDMSERPMNNRFGLGLSVQNNQGFYSRPRISLLCFLDNLNDSARLLYPEKDRRYKQSTVFTFGIFAEWWFDSSYRGKSTF